MEIKKSKATTYILICAVALIWGIVLKRILFTESDVGEINQIVKGTVKKEIYDQYLSNSDTVKLCLNYPDPFRGTTEALPDSQQTTLTKIAVKPIVPKIPARTVVNWAIVKYSGYVRNPKTNRLVAILQLEGKERMLCEGETFDGVKLIKNRKDSILLKYKGETKYIRQ